MRLLVAILLAAAWMADVGAQPATAQTRLSGTVTADGSPVPFASIGIRGTVYGTAADVEGRYHIHGLPPGTYTVAASAVGYKTRETEVTLVENQRLVLDFALREAVIESDGIVVTGTLVETFVEESPVKVDVISSQYLQKSPAASVMDAINRVNGLREQIDCGVCGTNNIRVNGMDGPYTVVLIDGMPIMSSLATVYGLNGLSPALIQQIEVIKGPMSTLYGTEALAGVINIITKSPQTAPRFSINGYATNHQEFNLDFGVVPSRSDLSGLVSGTIAYNQQFLDENRDDFGDLTLKKQASLFGKLIRADAQGNKQLALSGRVYFEDRIGGTRSFIDLYDPSLRGSDRHYGEAIRTGRVELLGSYHPWVDQGLRLDFAANEHRQDSYYGDQHYRAAQRTLFSQLIWHGSVAERQSMLVGAGVRYQQYDDNTGSTGRYDPEGALISNQPDNRLIPGVFAQHESVLTAGVRSLVGARLDYQHDIGIIFSPRLSLKASLGEATTLRLNGGTGFRVVNLFTEDHAAYTGARATVILEDLKPERSLSSTVSVRHVLPLGGNPMTFDADAFYTYFTNKIEPDYSTPGEIRYANLTGSATTRGASLAVSQDFSRLPVVLSAGVTVMDVFRSEGDRRTPIEFAPQYQGSGGITVTTGHDWTLDYTVTATGPMKLPEYNPPYSRAPWSPPYSVHDLQVTREFEIAGRGELHLYTALKNAFNYRQPSPLIDPAHPFGAHFDTNYVYGPIRGRNFGFGVRVILR